MYEDLSNYFPSKQIIPKGITTILLFAFELSGKEIIKTKTNPDNNNTLFFVYGMVLHFPLNMKTSLLMNKYGNISNGNKLYE